MRQSPVNLLSADAAVALVEAAAAEVDAAEVDADWDAVLAELEFVVAACCDAAALEFEAAELALAALLELFEPQAARARHIASAQATAPIVAIFFMMEPSLVLGPFWAFPQ